MHVTGYGASVLEWRGGGEKGREEVRGRGVSMAGAATVHLYTTARTSTPYPPRTHFVRGLPSVRVRVRACQAWGPYSRSLPSQKHSLAHTHKHTTSHSPTITPQQLRSRCWRVRASRFSWSHGAGRSGGPWHSVARIGSPSRATADGPRVLQRPPGIRWGCEGVDGCGYMCARRYMCARGCAWMGVCAWMYVCAWLCA